MIPAIRFTSFDPDIYDMFYGYHPPLAFLIARVFFLLGLPPVASVQVTSSLAMLMSFIFLRSTLRALSILHRPEAIAFLYITFALPLNVFLSYSINIDAVIFACGSGTLWATVRMLHSRESTRVAETAVAFLWTVVFLAAGLLTKFTGPLLLPLPLLMFLLLPERPSWRRLSLPACAIGIAILIALPYYHDRYYRTYGTWFPNNTEHFDADTQKAARAERDSDRIGFLLGLFAPAPSHRTGPEFRDLDHPRLSDTWKDVWMMDQWVIDRRGGNVPALARPIGLLYYAVAPFLLAAGLIAFLLRARDRDAWWSLGALLLSFTAILILALIVHMYQHPWAGGLPSKAIYIAPASLSIGYLLAGYFRYLRGFLSSKIILVCALLLLLAVNHVIPVY